MPALEFKGKQHIYAHHLGVPYRPLVPHPDKSVAAAPGDAPLPTTHLIIHGDNLHALKALLPRSKCCYRAQSAATALRRPREVHLYRSPLQHGHEGWVYNDKVNSPLMQAWLSENEQVNNDDLQRHDKWLCMMWPRLHLLRQLLSEQGVVFISIDDNEEHHLRMVMGEIFGTDNFISCCQQS